MFSTLLWQDRAVRSMLVTVPASLGAGLMLKLASTGADLERYAGVPLFQRPATHIAFFILGWLLCLLFLLTTDFWKRCSVLHMTLPLSSRMLTAVRITGIFLATLLPVAVMSLMMAARFPDGTAWPALNRDILAIGVRVHAGLFTTALVCVSPAATMHRIRLRLSYILPMAAVAAAAILYTIFTFQSVACLYGMLVAAMLLLVAIRYRTPPTFLVSPTVLRNGREVERSDPHATEKDGAGFFLFKHVTLFKVIAGNWSFAVFIPMLFLYSMLTVLQYLEGRNVIPFMFFSSLFLWTPVGHGFSRMHGVDQLPIPGRTMFRHAFLPGVVALVIGVSGAWTVMSLVGSQEVEISACCAGIEVPKEFWATAPAGVRPVIETEWGETHTPRTYPLAGSGGLSFYNPFEISSDNSPRFARYQVTRAVEAVYGRTVEIESDGEGKPIAPDLEKLSSSVRNRCLAMLFILAIVPCTVLYSTTFQWAKPARGSKLAFAAFPVSAVLIILVFVVGFMGERFGFTSLDALGAASAIAVRRLSELMPLPTAGLWLLAAVLAACGYLVLEHRSGVVESACWRRKMTDRNR